MKSWFEAVIHDPRWRVLIICALTLLALVLLARCAAAGECLRSADEVRALHPGAWPSWSGRRWRKCWYGIEQGSRGQAERRDMHTVASLPPTSINPAAAIAIPAACAPLPWPDDATPPIRRPEGPVDEAFAAMGWR